jgi:hypothetical protein
MAIEITQLFTRPNADVMWFIDTLPESHIEYIRENYVATGKLTGSTTRVDDLTLMQTFIFTTVDDQEEFITDPYMAEKASQRAIYNDENGILLIGDSVDPTK